MGKEEILVSFNDLQVTFLSFFSFCNAGINGSNLDDSATKVSSSESVAAGVAYKYRFLEVFTNKMKIHHDINFHGIFHLNRNEFSRKCFL